MGNKGICEFGLVYRIGWGEGRKKKKKKKEKKGKRLINTIKIKREAQQGICGGGDDCDAKRVVLFFSFVFFYIDGEEERDCLLIPPHRPCFSSRKKAMLSWRKRN